MCPLSVHSQHRAIQDSSETTAAGWGEVRLAFLEPEKFPGDAWTNEWLEGITTARRRQTVDSGSAA